MHERSKKEIEKRRREIECDTGARQHNRRRNQGGEYTDERERERRVGEIKRTEKERVKQRKVAGMEAGMRPGTEKEIWIRG